uniref:Uncharacterized protein n=1 Tax=Ditylenchus dipsaci TaxID=166011 RepID=A0A915DI85_9BILA
MHWERSNSLRKCELGNHCAPLCAVVEYPQSLILWCRFARLEAVVVEKLLGESFAHSINVRCLMPGIRSRCQFPKKPCHVGLGLSLTSGIQTRCRLSQSATSSLIFFWDDCILLKVDSLNAGIHTTFSFPKKEATVVWSFSAQGIKSGIQTRYCLSESAHSLGLEIHQGWAAQLLILWCRFARVETVVIENPLRCM